MKKTQSLKLMLLGLMTCFGSTSAWAQYTAKNGVVYGLNDTEDGAVVVGVISNKLSTTNLIRGEKQIEILDEVSIDGTSYDVVDFADGWKAAKVLKNDPVSGTAGSAPADPGLNDGSTWTPVQGSTTPTSQSVYTTVDATAITEKLDFVIRASKLTEITRDDIADLPIAAFVLAGTSGITEIPENLFAPAQKVMVANEAKQPEIDRTSAIYNGYTGYIINDGKYQGHQVYKMLLNANGTDPGVDLYLYVDEGESREITSGKYAGDFLNPAYLFEFDANNNYALTGKIRDGVYYQVLPKDGKLLAQINGQWLEVAVQFDGNAGPGHVDGSKDIAEKSAQETANALTAWNNAKEDVQKKATYIDYPEKAYTDEEAELSKKAKALLDAINAFQSDATKWGALRQHISASTDVNPDKIDAWYAAYVLANNPLENLSYIDDADKAYINQGNKVQNFKTAYTDYFGLDPQALQKTEVKAFSFTSYAAAGNIFTENLPATSENVHQLATGLVEDRSIDTADPEATVTVEGKKYFKVKVLQNSVDAANWEGKAFYVQLPDNKYIVTDTYYVLYEYKQEAGATEKSMKPVTFQTSVVTSLATEPQTVQLVATFANGKLNGRTPSDQKVRVTLVAAETTLSANRFVKVGNEVIPVTKLYVVTTEQSWNGRYYVDAQGNLYKQTGADWEIVDANNDVKHMLAERQMFTIPGTDASVSNETATMVVNINPTPETYEYTLSPKDAKTTIDDADPREQLEEEIIDYGTREQRVEAWEDAEQTAADAKVTYEAKKRISDADAQQAEKDRLKWVAAQNADDEVPTYVYNKNLKNETLLLGAFNNPIITSIGDRAFAQCVNAEFTGTFPTTIEYVGKESFLNPLLANADFSTAASEDLTISADAFKGTPLESLKLKGTVSKDITPAKIKAIVASLKKTDRNFAYSDACDNPLTGPVQNTLATVTLPDALTSILPNTFQKCIALTAIKIPASVVTIGKYAFDGCVALVMNKESFAGAESELTTIGESAFRGTGAVLVWLKDIEGLKTIGDYAFADMCKLKTVNLLNTQVDHLYGHTFENDGDLYKVVFNEAMKTLDEGLFSTNVLQELNLGSTQVEVLEDLFYAGTGFDVNGNLVRPAGMPEDNFNRDYKPKHNTVPNEDLTKVELPNTLTTIKSFALQSLKKLESIVVPSSVTRIEKSVFMNDVALKSAKFEDTPLSGLHSHTFAQCLSLEEVIFTSTAGVKPNLFYADPTTQFVFDPERISYGSPYGQASYGFGDNLFFASNTAKTPENTPMPVVTVSMDDYMALKGTKEYLEHYSTLKAATATITLGGPIKYNGVDYYWKTYKSPYGTWIKSGQGVDVFTAYEDGDDIILYPAKIRGGYYKIAAYDPEGKPRISTNNPAYGTNLTLGNDDASVCIIRSTSKTITATADYDASPLLIRNGDLKVQSTLDLENQLMAVQGDIWGNSATNFYVFGKKSDGTLTFKHITSDTYVIETGDICLMTTTDKGLESRNIVVVEPDEATAVQGVKEYLEGVKSGAIYNLQGVRVSTTQKGKMYIQGGKKFIQK